MRIPLLFSLIVLVSGCFGKGAQSPAQETIRGALQGVGYAVKIETLACADIVTQMDKANHPHADDVYDTCKDAFDVAHDALTIADSMLDAWEMGQKSEAEALPKIACLTGRALVSLKRMRDVFELVNVTLPRELQVTIADGEKLGKFLVALSPAGGSCALPPKPAPAMSQPTLLSPLLPGVGY